MQATSLFIEYAKEKVLILEVTQYVMRKINIPTWFALAKERSDIIYCVPCNVFHALRNSMAEHD